MNAPRSALLRLGLPVFATLLGFALTVGLAGRFLPPREMPSAIREKLAHLAAEGDAYEVLFIGSSRIQNHIIPSLFDQLAATGGRPVKTFNAGIPSMHAPEDDWFLEQILARKPARLRWIFIEVDYFPTILQEDQQGTLRGVAWHDWPRFRQLCQRLLVMKKGIGWRDKVGDTFERLRDFIQHLASFGTRSTHLGRGTQLFERWRFDLPPEPMNWGKLGVNRDGWLPAQENDDAAAQQRLAQVLDTRRKTAPKPQQADRASQAALAGLMEKVTRAGAVPILVIPPRARANYFVPSPENARRAAAVIDLCDPRRHPEFYEMETRIDLSHLNLRGAELFTRLLVERFLQLPPSTPAPR